MGGVTLLNGSDETICRYDMNGFRAKITFKSNPGDIEELTCDARLVTTKEHKDSSSDLHDLESNTGNISLRLSLTTETSEEDFIVLVDEVETTIVGDECSDLLSVLDQLDSDTLSDGGVGLFGLNTNLLENYALGVGRSSEWR